MKLAFALATVAILALSVSAPTAANARGKQGYASARAACLIVAGTDEITFINRRASTRQGYDYKQCMTRKGHDIAVTTAAGQRLF